MTVEVRIIESVNDAMRAALAELRVVVQREDSPLVSFATGATFARMLEILSEQLREETISPFSSTHLDEYLGFGSSQQGGMVCELRELCPELDKGFVVVPSDGSDPSIAAHQEKLASMGGVSLQYLGLGRNGHVGFNEPGSSFESRFHVVELSETTRWDNRHRFDGEGPTHAVTAGLASIKEARRIVLVALGEHKADAVKAMLEGEVGPHCPATIVRDHPSALVLLDEAAANELS